MWCCDVIHDVMASPDDVTSENKRHISDVVHPKRVNTELPKNGCETQGKDHPDCWVVHLMPQPPPHIWAHPHDQSLQLLYLSTLYYNRCTFTNIQIYKSEDGWPSHPASSEFLHLQLPCMHLNHSLPQ